MDDNASVFWGSTRRAVGLRAVLSVGVAFASLAAAAQDESVEADHHVLSRPENLSWGFYPIDKKPVLTIRSGETVRVDTLTHAGATQDENPVAYLTGLGVPREEILQDVLDFWVSRDGRPREGRGGHVITGPLYIDGAEPGDMLEVQILHIETRVPWGINNTSATGGVFSSSYPGVRSDDPLLDIPEGTRHVIRTGVVEGREVAFVAPDIQVPLAPFLGILAVAPDPVVGQPGVTLPGVQSSRPPGAYGGNLDVKDFGAGTTVYLPVFHRGALFYTGDSARSAGRRRGERYRYRAVPQRRLPFRRPQGRGPFGPARGNGYALPVDGDRPRSRPGDAERGVGSGELPGERERAHAGQGIVPRQHRRRFSRQRGRRPDPGGYRVCPKRIFLQSGS